VTPLAGRFFRAGVVMLLAGLALGMHMSIADDATLRPVHAHLNLVGFVLPMIYGLYYQVLPGTAEGWWPVAHVWAAVMAAVCLPLGMALIILGHPGPGEPVSFLGMLATVAAALVFARAVFRSGRPGEPRQATVRSIPPST
jgi:peptidoglycan/LPS O-acetylase OafA/YrhL